MPHGSASRRTGRRAGARRRVYPRAESRLGRSNDAKECADVWERAQERRHRRPDLDQERCLRDGGRGGAQRRQCRRRVGPAGCGCRGNVPVLAARAGGRAALALSSEHRLPELRWRRRQDHDERFVDKVVQGRLQGCGGNAADRSAERHLLTATIPRVEHWLRCREKRCCSYALVIVTGRDLARIAHTIGVAPWSFTTAIAAPADADDAFALDTSPRRWRLALSRIQFERSASPQCVFLLRLPGGNARCGLGEGRPAACRAFPNEGGAETCSCSWDGVPLDDEPAGGEGGLLAPA